MAQMNDEALLNGIDEILNDTAVDSADAEAALPFEAFEDYSTDPLSFNDQSKLMLYKVEALFDLAVKYNRHSSQYLKTVGRLEQGIKYLASGCVTKVALEGNKNELPDLGQLTTEKLFRMASYHYRKIDRALTEYIEEHKGEINDGLMDMQFRYFNLLNRLRATEVKIYNYNIKLWYDDKKNYDPIVNGLAFSQKSWNKSFNKDHLEPASFQKARAFSALFGTHEVSSDAAAKPALQNGTHEAEQQNNGDSHRCPESVTHGNSPLVPCTDAAAETVQQNLTHDAEQRDNGDCLRCPESVTHGNSPLESLGTCSVDSMRSQRKQVPVTQVPAAQDVMADANAPRFPYGVGGGRPENEIPRINKHPGYFDILLNAAMRTPMNEQSDDGTLFTFEPEDIVILAYDPEFTRDCPEMAEQIRNQLKAMMDSG